MCSKINVELFSKHLLLESVEDIPNDLPQEVENLEVTEYMELVMTIVELFIDEFFQEFEFIFAMNYTRIRDSESDFKQFVIPRCLKLSGECTYLNFLLVCSFVTHLSHSSNNRRGCTRFVVTAAACIVTIFKEKFQQIFDDLGGWIILKSLCETALGLSDKADWLIALTGNSECKTNLLQLIARCYEEDRYWISCLLNGTAKSFDSYENSNYVSKSESQYLEYCTEPVSNLHNPSVPISACDASNLNGIGNKYLDVRFELLSEMTRALYACQNKILMAHSNAYVKSCKAIFDCKNAVTLAVSERDDKSQDYDEVPEYIIDNLELAFGNVLKSISMVAKKVNKHFGSIFAHDSDVFKSVIKIDGQELESTSQMKQNAGVVFDNAKCSKLISDISSSEMFTDDVKWSQADIQSNSSKLHNQTYEGDLGSTRSTNTCFDKKSLYNNLSKKCEIKNSIDPFVLGPQRNGMRDIAAQSGSSLAFSNAFTSGEQAEITPIDGEQSNVNFKILTVHENNTSKFSPNIMNENTKVSIVYPNNSSETLFENFNGAISDNTRNNNSSRNDMDSENSIESKIALHLNMAVQRDVKEISPSFLIDNSMDYEEIPKPVGQIWSLVSENAIGATVQLETVMKEDFGRNRRHFPIASGESMNTDNSLEKANNKNPNLFSGLASKIHSNVDFESTQKCRTSAIYDLEKTDFSKKLQYKNYISPVISNENFSVESKKILVNQNDSLQFATISNRIVFTGDHSELCEWCGCLCYAYVIMCQEEYRDKHIELSRTG